MQTLSVPDLVLFSPDFGFFLADTDLAAAGLARAWQ